MCARMAVGRSYPCRVAGSRWSRHSASIVSGVNGVLAPPFCESSRLFGLARQPRRRAGHLCALAFKANSRAPAVCLAVASASASVGVGVGPPHPASPPRATRPVVPRGVSAAAGVAAGVGVGVGIVGDPRRRRIGRRLCPRRWSRIPCPRCGSTVCLGRRPRPMCAVPSAPSATGRKSSFTTSRTSTGPWRCRTAPRLRPPPSAW